MSKFEIISLIVQLLLGLSAIAYLYNIIKKIYRFLRRKIKILKIPKDIQHGIIFIDQNLDLNLKWEKVADMGIYNRPGQLYYKISIELESYNSSSIPMLIIDGEQHKFNKLFISRTSVLLILDDSSGIKFYEFSPRYVLKNMILAGKKLSPEQYSVIKSLKCRITTL